MIMMSGIFSDSVCSFYAGPSNRIDVSHDAGIHWTTATAAAPPIGSAVFARFGGLMAMGTTQGVFFSSNEFKTASRSIVPSTVHSFQSATMHVSQQAGAIDLFDLQGRRLPETGGCGATGMVVIKPRLETGRIELSTKRFFRQK
jgi:hypothetical protein